ncbi:sensor histidine kinase [Gangjinia marincola]|uniref:sensor histidine kinase n=1 Tax=Gangjinia marincola TaxID=578463 RepID=UPI0031E0A86C
MKFKEFTHPDKRGYSVFSLSEDHIGRIWCINLSGQVFYVNKNELVLFLDLKDELNGELPYLTAIGEYVYLFCNEKIIALSPKDKTFSIDNFGSNALGVPTLFHDTLMVTFENSLLQLNPKKMLFDDSELTKANERRNKNLLFPHQNKLYALGSGIDNEIFEIDIILKEVLKIRLPPALLKLDVHTIIPIDRNLWICTRDGIFIGDIEDNSIVIKRHFLSGIFITDVVKNQEGLFWISTLDQGIYIVTDLNVSKFNSPSHHITTMVKIDESQILYGTIEGELYLYNLKDFSIKKLNTPKTINISALHYDKQNGILYVGSSQNGFALTDNFSNVILLPFGLSAKSITEVSPKEILYASAGLSSFLSLTDDLELIESKNIREHRAYSAHHNPITKYNYVSDIDHFISIDSSHNESIITYKGENFYSSQMDADINGISWISTFHHGVLGVKNDSVVYAFDKNEGLLSDQIFAIHTHQDEIYIASDKGIQVLNSTTHSLRTLIDLQTNFPARINGMEIFDQNLVVGTNQGVYGINNNYKQNREFIPNIYISSLKVKDEAIEVKDTLYLPFDENTIELSAHANLYKANDRLLFEYSLQGKNAGWFPLEQGGNSIVFSNLEPGLHSIKIKAKDSYTNLSSRIKEVVVFIEKPIWRKWWFILWFFAILSFILLTLFRFFLHKQNLEKVKAIEELDRENQLILLKLENLRSQMNPHFVFNALNSIQEYIVINEKNLASNYLGKFADLMRSFLSLSNKGYISIEEEVKNLNMYLELEKMRFEEKLVYNIQVDDTLNQNEIYIPTMLIQPYVENSLNHGLLHKKDQRILNIFFTNKNSTHFKCIIEDNGIGRKKAEEIKLERRPEHKSFATKTTNNRLTLINYGKVNKIELIIEDLYDSKNMPCGTKVILFIPLNLIS